MDLSQLSDEELIAIAGGGGTPTATVLPQVDLSSLSNEELLQLAGTSTSTAKPLTAHETFAGGMSDILNKLTFGYGDELQAGASTLFGDAYTGAANLFGANRQPENYDANLSQVRDLTARYQNENPTSSAINNAAALLMPLPGGGAKAATTAAPTVKVAPSLLKTVGKGSVIGSVSGGASGFGNAEGGVENRLKSGAMGAGIGALVGGTVPLVVGGAGKMAGYVSDKFDDGAAAVREQGLGVMAGDRSRGLKNLPQYLDDSGNVVDKASATTVSAPIEEQIALLTRKGILQEAPNSPRQLQAYLSAKAADAGDDVGKLISEADQALGNQQLQVPFNETAKFFEQLGKQNPAKAEELAGDFARVLDNYNKAGAIVNPVTGQASQGSVGALSRINAIKAGTKADVPMWQTAGDKPRVELYRAMYRDLQKFEDEVFNATLPNKAGLFKEAKDLYGALTAVGTTITKAGARKAPTLGNALEGGSKLPATIFLAGSPIVGPGVATAASGAYVLGRGVKNTLQNKYPMTAANLYDNAGSVAGGLSSLLEGGASGAIPAISSAIGAGMAEKSPSSSGILSALDQPTSTDQVTPDQEFVLPSDVRSQIKTTPTPEAKMEEKPVMQEMVQESQETEKPAEKPKVDPTLIKAVVWQESRGKSDAVSPKGATGLMQIMPETAREIAAELGYEEGEYDLKDPEISTEFGTHYLNKMMRQFKDEGLALAAYNAGPGQVAKWVKKYGNSWEKVSGGIKRDILDGKLSPKYYKETMQYVPSILKKRSKLVEA